MELKLTCFLLVILGIVVLIYSLKPSLSFCKQPKHDSDWGILFFLIIFFCVGYSLFAWHILNHPVTYIELVVSLVLVCGSGFVILVIKLCSRSIEYTERLAALARHHALHDDLTGLANRKFLRDRIGEALNAAKQNNLIGAVLLMDLDRFKEVNDTLGHHVGDQLLQQITPRLHNSIRDCDTVARLGGDEFAVLLPDTSTDTAISVARRILEVMEPPFEVEQNTLTIGLSLGICMYPQHGENQDTLLRHADVAMYMAKRKGIDYAIYSRDQDQYSLSRLKQSNKLKETINEGGLEMYYQPVIDIQNNRLRGLEALSRWRLSSGEFIPATEFIPLAESTGLIQKLTHWGLKTAISQLALWQRQGIDCIIAVNLSAKDLQNTEITTTIQDTLEEFGIAPENLMLEITESSVMTDLQQVEGALVRLDKLGIQLAIDDFGTGYSSLYRLKNMPISVLKIDRSFILDLSEDENDELIVNSTIDLAHNLGKKVVAEGVENSGILNMLKKLDCDFAQGFNIGIPLPASHIPSWLAQFQTYDGNINSKIERRANG